MPDNNPTTTEPEERVCHVLIAHRDPMDVLQIRRLTRSEHGQFVIHHVRNGLEACAYFDDRLGPVPDLMIVEEDLPMINGCQVVESLKAKGKITATTVIVVQKARPDGGEIRYKLHVSASNSVPSHPLVSPFMMVVQKYFRSK